MSSMASPTSSIIKDGDFQYKMCKKVAQLTKVIYTLNCRTEDNETRTQWLVRCHEDEILRLEKACKERMESAAAKVKQAEEAKAHTIRSLEASYQSAVREAQNVFGDKLRKLTVNAEAAKESYKRERQEFAEKTIASHREEVDNLRVTKDAEMANLVKEYNERYKAMLAEQLNAKDGLERELNKEWAQRLQAAEEEHASKCRVLEGQAQTARSQLQSETTIRASLARQLDSVKDLVSQVELQNRSLNKEKDELQLLLDTERSHLSAAKETEEALQKRMASLEVSHAAKTLDFEQAQQKVHELQRQIERLSSDCVHAQNEARVEATQRKTTEHELVGLRTLRDELQTMNASLVAQLAALSADEQSKHSEAANLQELLAETKNQLAALALQHEEGVQALQHAHEEALNEARRHAEVSVAELTAQLRREKEQLRDDLERKLHEEESMHKKERALLEQLNQENHRTLQGELELVQREKEALQAQWEEAQHARNVLQMEYSALDAEYQAHKKDSEAQKGDTAVTIARMREELLTLSQKSAIDLHAQHRDSEERAAASKQAHEALQRRFEEEKLQLQSDWEARLSEVSESHSRLTDELHRVHALELRDLQNASEYNLKTAKLELVREMQELREAAEREIQQAKSTAERLQRDLGAELEAAERRLALQQADATSERLCSANEVQKLNTLLENLQQTLAQREREHHAALHDAMEASRREMEYQINSVRENSRQELDALRKTMAATMNEHVAQIDSLTRASKARAIEEEEKWSQILEKTKEQMTMAQQALERRLIRSQQLQMEALQQRADATIAERDQQLCQMAKQLKDASNESISLRQNLQSVTDELESAVNRMKQEAHEAEEARARLYQEHVDTVQHMDAQHTTQLHLIFTEHKKLVDDMMIRHEKERQAHNALILQMQETYNELQHKYNYRESRSEDVDMINRLLCEKREKEKELKRAYEDMQQYKLELVNREENYNKIFGNRPIVAADRAMESFPGAQLSSSTNLPFINKTWRSTQK